VAPYPPPQGTRGQVQTITGVINSNKFARNINGNLIGQLPLYVLVISPPLLTDSWKQPCIDAVTAANDTKESNQQ